MNLTNLRTNLREQIGNVSVVDKPDAKLNDLINEALQQITNRYRFHKARKRCTFVTVRGQSAYGLPVDVEVVYRLWDQTNRRKLEKIGDRQFSSQTNDATTYGIQTQYVRYRDFVELYPTPQNDGDVIEVFYKYYQIPLSNESDEPGIPAVWHYAIVLWAKYLYYQKIGDAPKKQDAYNDYKLWIADKPTEIDEESVDIDSGVDVLSLSQRLTPAQDFNHAD